MSAPASISSYFGTGTPTVSSGKTNDQLNSDDFMHLLTVQMENQNPLDPMKDTDYFAQIAQLGEVQGIDNLNANSDIQKAQELFGQTVTAPRPSTDTTSNDPTITGTVTRLTVKDGTYYIGIQKSDGTVDDVDISTVTEVQPSTQLSPYADMVGKTVSGPATITAADGTSSVVDVTGTVSNVATINNNVTLTVNTTNYGNVSVDYNQLTGVSN